MSPRFGRPAAALAVGLLSLTACGGQTLAEYNRAKSAKAHGALVVPVQDKAKSVIDAIKPEPDLAKTLPDSVKSNGLRMSTSEGYPPMEMFASDGKTLIGLDPSLARAIGKKLGVAVTVGNADFNAQIPGVITDRFDMIMSSMTDNKEREKTITFVDYVSAGAGMLVKKGNPKGINSGADVCGRTISVVDNGSSLDAANGYSAACTKAGKPAAKILKFTGDQDALLALTSGRADVNITDYVVCVSKASQKRLGLEAIALKGTEAPWGIGMKPSNKGLIEAVRASLEALIKSGEYQKVLDAWGLKEMAVKSAVVNGAKS